MGDQPTIPIDHLPTAPGIYKIIHAPSDSLYVGQAQDIRRRAKQHVDGIVNVSHPTRKILKLVKKYGVEGWAFEVIEQCGEVDLDDRESHWIETLSPNLNTMSGRTPKDEGDDWISLRIDLDQETDAALEAWAKRDHRSKREQAAHVVRTFARAVDQDPLIWPRIWVEVLSKLNVHRL